jgi:PAS domain S-box-containing protein
MYRLLLNASPEGIIIMDIEGRIKEISNITSGIFGITEKQEFIGKNIMDLFPNDEHERIQEVIKKTLNDGLAQNEEFVLHKANQTEFMSEISLTLIRDNDGRPSALMAIIRDISQRKKMEQQLIHNERMAGLGEMAAGIAHEINQPLNIMSLSFENILYELSLKKKIDEASLHNRSEKIFESLLRIEKIIDHIRDFSREQQDYILTLFDVNESIINAESVVAEQFRLKNIELVNILNEKNSKVVGNTYKFEQVILNLLLNAKDALEEKEAISDQEFHKIIKIKTSEDEHNIFIEIVDNGVGIKPDELHKIMLPFYSTKEPGKGTGLGLSISFGIIKEMNGNIEVTSVFSSGTKTRIILPIENASHSQD